MKLRIYLGIKPDRRIVGSKRQNDFGYVAGGGVLFSILAKLPIFYVRAINLYIRYHLFYRFFQVKHAVKIKKNRTFYRQCQQHTVSKFLLFHKKHSQKSIDKQKTKRYSVLHQ